MLAMLWSLIKIAVSYLRGHSDRSVLVLRCLLSDHTGCWHNYKQLFNYQSILKPFTLIIYWK